MRSPTVIAVLILAFLSVSALEVQSAEPAKEISPNEAAKLPPTKGLGDLGSLEALVVGHGDHDAGTVAPGATLAGPDARHQLLVTGKYSSGNEVDLSRQVAYSVKPEGVVAIDNTGLVTPIKNGEATVTATWEDFDSDDGDREATAKVVVSHMDSEIPVNFPNQIVPLFTKYGCNGGGCHGKSGGQNGFRLGLLGFYPRDDYEYLIKEGRGRRVNVAAPDRSLLLLKAANVVPHGGGARIHADTHEYRTIYRWMKQGMPYGSDSEAVVESIEVFPPTRRMERQSQQQLTVFATFSDGRVEDVTRIAAYESNDGEMAEVSDTGLVHTLDLSGEAAVMIRYMGQVAVFRSILPLGVEVKNLPEPRNFIDELVFSKWKSLGIPPSTGCDDNTYLRRVTVDLTGRLPTFDETLAFEKDEAKNKRDLLVDRLLASTDHAEYFANKWGAILRNRRSNGNYTRGTYAFSSWLRDSIHQNRPYDQIVRDIVGASGDIVDNPPVAWYRAVKTTDQQVEDSAQLFLGLRIQCARCHHHPFEKWSQKDYYGYAAFFSRIGRKANREGRPEEQRVFHNPGKASARNPRTNASLTPTGLGAEPLVLDNDTDPRQKLVDWMVDPSNEFFAKAFVNRYWKHFFSRGLVEPEDDMRVTNPPSHPELLDALAKHFVDKKFDMKDLVREICRSTVYQLSAYPNAFNIKDKQSFARYYPKRLNAEVLYDALHQVTGTNANFAGMPKGTRAVELPDSGINNYFLTVFGRPMGESSCECERSNDASLAQSLHLLNSKDVLGKVSSNEGRAAKLAASKATFEERIGELYLWAYSRRPDEKDLAVALEHLKVTKDKRAAFEDIVWALINTKEFLFNH